MYVKIKHVNRIVAKGRAYFYHRITKERLPDDADEMIARVTEINAGLSKTSAGVPPAEGTMGDLIALYKASPEWSRLGHRTRTAYGRYLEWWRVDYGDLRVAEIDRESIIEARDLLKDTPRTADFTIQVLSILLSYALDRPRRFGLQFNPAAKIGNLADPNGYKPWPDNLLRLAREKATTELRQVIDMARFTGLRGGDVVGLAWPQWKGDGFEIVTERPDEPLWVPAGPDLKALMRGIERRGIVVLTTPTGRPWKIDHMRHEIAALVAECGFEGYSLHGLRKLAGKTLAENGATEKQIGAILGHKTLQMVQLYTKAAEQKRLAQEGIKRLRVPTKRTKKGRRR